MMSGCYVVNKLPRRDNLVTYFEAATPWIPSFPVQSSRLPSGSTGAELLNDTSAADLAKF